jgi:hypothetical protein
MNLEESPLGVERIVNLQGIERWEAYHRLQSLQIPCQCSTHKPLRVRVDTPIDVLQVWSVIRQIRSSRQTLVGWLETCWRSTPEKT